MKMKNVFILLSAILLVGCRCLSQIPPQVIYVDLNCEAPLPDYTLVVTASDNCSGVTISQMPLPGTVLNTYTPSVEVTITATDAFGLADRASFVVIALDTIPPVLEFPASFYAFNQDNIGGRAAFNTFNRWVQYNLCEWMDMDYLQNPYYQQYDSIMWISQARVSHIKYDIFVSDSLYQVYLNSK